MTAACERTEGGALPPFFAPPAPAVGRPGRPCGRGRAASAVKARRAMRDAADKDWAYSALGRNIQKAIDFNASCATHE